MAAITYDLFEIDVDSPAYRIGKYFYFLGGKNDDSKKWRRYLAIGQEMRHELRPPQFVSEDELLVSEWTCAFFMWPLEPCLELFLLLLLRGKVIVNDETLVMAYDFR